MPGVRHERVHRRRRGARRDPQGQEQRAAIDAHRGRPRHGVRPRRPVAGARARASTTCARPVGSPATSTSSRETSSGSRSCSPTPTRRRTRVGRGGARRGSGLARRARRPVRRARRRARRAARPAGWPRRPSARMEALIELLGSPQLQYPAIHITGTNGKTSTARMTTALLVSAGLSVGTDTSPYLQRLNERMSWNGEPISDEELDRILVLLAEVEPLLADRPSYMEIINAAAFEWFADIAVDVAVIEVGLGGQLGRHQRRRRPGGGRHQRRARPRGVPRPDRARHRGGEGRHREAGVDARARRDRSRARPDLHRARPRARSSPAVSTSV